MNKILYIGNFSINSLNAAGKRVYANALLLKDLGYEVHLFSASNIEENCSYQKKMHEQFYPFNYYELYVSNSFIRRINHAKAIQDIEYLINKHINISTVDFVFFYSTPYTSLFTLKLIKLFHEKGISTISDTADWLRYTSGNFVYKVFKNVDNYFFKNVVNKRVNGIIAISNFLNRYYLKRNANVIKIPPLSYDIIEKSKEQYSLPIKLVYAGIPFRKNFIIKNSSQFKDRIDLIFEAFVGLNVNNKIAVLEIIGFTKKEYLDVYPKHVKVIDSISNFIKFHGHIDNTNAVEIISKSDYSVLVRDKRRETTAGFPSKVVESYSLLTPTITNDTSDLNEYISNNYNGFIIDDLSASSLRSKIIELSAISNDNYLKIKKNIYKNQVFYYRNYVSTFKFFLNSIGREREKR